jgi:hypothetical protein
MDLLESYGIYILPRAADIINGVIANHPYAVTFRPHFLYSDLKWCFMRLIEPGYFAGNDEIEVSLKPKVNHLPELNLRSQVSDDGSWNPK